MDLPLDLPISLGLIEYSDGGAEFFAVERYNSSSSKTKKLDDIELSPEQFDCHILMPLQDKAERSRFMTCGRAKTKV